MSAIEKLLRSYSRMYTWREGVDRAGGGDTCHPWRYSVDRDGYPRPVYGSSIAPHRLSYIEYYNKQLSSDVDLHHLCKNRRCCNPLHLKEISHREHSILHTYGG